MKKISIIAAIGPNNLIGRNGRLPWYFSEDLKRFKKITMGHPIIMGRKTYESIGKPLPGRQNIIITKNENYKAKGCLVTHSLEEAIEKSEDNPFIIGGSEIYKQALPLADYFYLTEVKSEPQGEPSQDIFFPDFNKNNWLETEREDYPEFNFITLKRK